MRIAVFQQNPTRLKSLTRILSGMHHQCVAFASAAFLPDSLRHQTFDLLVLPWQANGGGAVEVLREIKGNENSAIPVVVVNFVSKDEPAGDPASIARCLDMGADDVVSGRWKPEIFAARVRAVLRRTYRQSDMLDRITFGHITFDIPNARVLLHNKTEVVLKQREFDLALYLFQHRNLLLSREQLLDSIWLGQANPDSRSLDTHMSRIRAKLQLFPEHGYNLHSVYARGYRLDQIADERRAAPSFPSARLSAVAANRGICGPTDLRASA